MNRTAASALEGADIVVQVVEATRWTAEDDLALERIKTSGRPAILAVNKVDRVHPRELLLPYIASVGAEARLPRSRADLRLEGERHRRPATHDRQTSRRSRRAMFPDGELTDRGRDFRIAEMIREKLTLELNQEVPYGIAVEVERAVEEDGQLVVDAAIWVDREGQKPIVIGAKGERLKRVGRSARLALNELLGRRLHLTLWVKVRENWADNARALQELGLE